MNEEKSIVLKKMVRRVGDGGTYIVEDAPTPEQMESFAGAVDQLHDALLTLFDMMKPAIEQFVRDVAPIIAELEGYDPKADARARSRADVASKRSGMRRRKGRV